MCKIGRVYIKCLYKFSLLLLGTLNTLVRKLGESAVSYLSTYTINITIAKNTQKSLSNKKLRIKDFSTVAWGRGVLE